MLASKRGGHIMLNGIHHVSINVRDVDAAIRFYVDLLGMQQIERPDRGGPGAWLRISWVSTPRSSAAPRSVRRRSSSKLSLPNVQRSTISIFTRVCSAILGIAASNSASMASALAGSAWRKSSWTGSVAGRIPGLLGQQTRREVAG